MKHGSAVITSNGATAVMLVLGRHLYGDGSSECRRFQLLMLLHLHTLLLQLVVVDDVLVGGATLGECVQLVHVVHVAPQVL